MPRIDISQERFGTLVAIEVVGRRPGHTLWKCQCDCGHEVVVQLSNLRTGHTRNCGCSNRAELGIKELHGYSGSRTHHSWRGMLERCRNPHHEAYRHYGGRGIKVCKRWRYSFLNFLADMGERPEGMTLDRKNVNGHYTKRNCRWATPVEQANNRRNS